MPAHSYEITFRGEADRTLRAQFDDCQVSTGPGTSTLRADVADQAALCGLVQRIAGLGLEIIHLRLLTPPGPGTGASPGVQDDPAEVAPGGHQVDGLGHVFKPEVDGLRTQLAGGEQVP